MQAQVSEELPPTVGQLEALLDSARKLGASSTSTVRVRTEESERPYIAPVTTITISWETP